MSSTSNGGGGWAEQSTDEPDHEAKIERAARVWRIVGLIFGGLATVLLGVVLTTLSASLTYDQLIEDNLRLKAQVEDIEAKITKVDRVLLRLRLYDARLMSLSNEAGASTQTKDGKDASQVDVK